MQSFWAEYRRGKTGVEAELPILSELAEELARVPRSQMLFLPTPAGAAHSVAGFGNWFKAQAVAAGVTGGNGHGLLKAGATPLAEAGASEGEIASYLAHEDTKMAVHYVRKANRAKLGSAALARLDKLKQDQDLSNPHGRLDDPSKK